MAASLLAMACSQTPKENDVTPVNETNMENFAENNIPAGGLDLKEYSEGIQHIGIPTTEIQKTIDFYKGLGFSLATRHDINGRDFAFMQLGNLFLEIIPTSEPAMKNGAVDHFCLDVKNIDTLFGELKAAGYTMLDDSVNSIGFWENGAKYFFIQGPNNEKIEFCEIL